MPMNGLKSRISALGYTLAYNQRDAWGCLWRYRTSPSQSGGPINYFATRAQLARWVAQVEQIRQWELELGAN